MNSRVGSDRFRGRRDNGSRDNGRRHRRSDNDRVDAFQGERSSRLINNASQLVRKIVLDPAAGKTRGAEVLDIILNTQSYKASLRKQGVDLDRLPLEKITDALIDSATSVLKDLESVIARKMELCRGPQEARASRRFRFSDGKDLASMEVAAVDKKIDELSQTFWDLIPPKQPVQEPINDFQKLRKLVELLEEMRGVVFSLGFMKSADAVKDTTQDLFSRPLERVEGSDVWKIVTALANTRGSTHTQYRLVPKMVLNCTDSGEVERHKLKGFHKETNRRLLWHGSPLANWPSILRHGLLISPSKTPRNGAMFDAGIYFTDMSTKSAGYCKASEEAPFGVLALAEVALGVPYQRVEHDYHAATWCAENKVGHTWGVGRYRPDEKGKIPMRSVIDGETVYLSAGKQVTNESAFEEASSKKTSWNPTSPHGVLRTFLKGPPSWAKSTLLYNEFIVYDVARVILRYLIVVEFSFTASSS